MLAADFHWPRARYERVAVSTSVACARNVPTMQFPRPRIEKGSCENSRMAFRCVIVLIYGR